MPTKPNPWAAVELQCQSTAREYVKAAGKTAVELTHRAGRYPTESCIREAQVQALTWLVAGAMARNAELTARVERLEVGWWGRVKRWWRRLMEAR